MSDNTEALIACPFCGGEPILNHIEPHSHSLQIGDWKMPDHPGSWTIECCDVGMIKDTREEVVAAWNRRTSPPSAVNVQLGSAELDAWIVEVVSKAAPMCVHPDAATTIDIGRAIVAALPPAVQDDATIIIDVNSMPEGATLKIPPGRFINVGHGKWEKCSTPPAAQVPPKVHDALLRAMGALASCYAHGDEIGFNIVKVNDALTAVKAVLESLAVPSPTSQKEE